MKEEGVWKFRSWGGALGPGVNVICGEQPPSFISQDEPLKGSVLPVWAGGRGGTPSTKLHQSSLI